MTNLICRPFITKFANTDFMYIRVDNETYYIVSQLPLDEDGITGFPIQSDKVVKEIGEILYDGYEYFYVAGLDEWAACISERQVEELFGHFAFKKECVFAQDLLMGILRGDLSRAIEYRRSVNQ